MFLTDWCPLWWLLCEQTTVRSVDLIILLAKVNQDVGSTREESLLQGHMHISKRFFGAVINLNIELFPAPWCVPQISASMENRSIISKYYAHSFLGWQRFISQLVGSTPTDRDSDQIHIFRRKRRWIAPDRHGRHAYSLTDAWSKSIRVPDCLNY